MDESTLRELVKILRTEHGLRYDQLLEAYTGTPSIPASAFATKLTPLETAVLYLHTHRQLSPKQIAKLLSRSTSIVNNALKNAKKKKVPLKDNVNTPYRIPTNAFTNKNTPAETVVHYLHNHYHLPNKTIAEIIGRDPRNIWNVLRGGKQ